MFLELDNPVFEGFYTDSDNCYRYHSTVPMFPVCIHFDKPAQVRQLDENFYYPLRIIGGKHLEPSRYPWQAVLLIYDVNGQAMLCGGTVLDDYWILTAAHCVSGRSETIYILTGVRSLQNPRKTSKATHVYVHPAYDSFSITNDIALLKSSKKLLDDVVKPICLTRNDDAFLAPGTTSIVTGFGLRFQNLTSPVLTLSNSIMATEVPIISHSSCLSSWDSATAGLIRISNKEVCAGSLLHGTSPGDSGGPLLVVDSLGRDVQIGITSFGAGGLRGVVDQNTFPGVYTRVSKYVPWIESVTTSEGSARNVFSVIVFIYLSLICIN
ncbi:unnamed protein product [Auanema sp. JU1783]|nr:unnamed protein product [Auanema sp. JU1783]